MGARFKVPISVLWPATDGNDFPLQSDYMALYSRYVDSVRQILDYLHKNRYSTRICIELKPFEPRSHIMTGTTAQALCLVNEINDPNFGMNLDIGHSLIARENLEDQISLIGRYRKLFHTHFNDNDQQCDADLPPGTVNFIRLVTVLYVLDEMQYDGWFGPDLFPYRDAPRKFMTLSRDNLRLGTEVVALLKQSGASALRAGEARWYEWNGSKWMSHPLAFMVHGHTCDIADVDGDGNLDIMIGEMGRPGAGDQARTLVWYGDGKGNFRRTVASSGQGIHEGRLVDFNGDGRVDILMKPYNHNAPRVDVLLNLPDTRPKATERPPVEDPPPARNLPVFWKSGLEDIETEVKAASKGEVRVMARSPGGLPVYAVSYGKKENFHSQANFVPVFIKERVQVLSRRLEARFKKAGLPYGRVFSPGVEDAKFPPTTTFNLVSALHHVSGAMAFTFECTHGAVSDQISLPKVGHEEILDIQLTLFDEMLSGTLENRFYWQPQGQ